MQMLPLKALHFPWLLQSFFQTVLHLIPLVFHTIHVFSLQLPLIPIHNAGCLEAEYKRLQFQGHPAVRHSCNILFQIHIPLHIHPLFQDFFLPQHKDGSLVLFSYLQWYFFLRWLQFLASPKSLCACRIFPFSLSIFTFIVTQKSPAKQCRGPVEILLFYFFDR